MSRNFVRLLAVHFGRSRFARPLLPKGVAVRKGEAAIIQTHRAVSNLSSSVLFQNEAPLYVRMRARSSGKSSFGA